MNEGARRRRLGASLTFCGAAGTVTGSRFLVETDRTRLLVDAGLFQGARSLRRRNWEPPFVDPATLDAVVVSHAHLDHSGYLPVLTRHGYSGPIWCSPATSQLVPIVLADAAHLQEREAEQSRRGHYSKHAPPKALFEQRDAEDACRLIRAVPFDVTHRIGEDMTVRLRPAGHILGSAFIELDAAGTRVLFSGDLGRPGHPLLRPPAPPHDADVLVVESTYGDEEHPPPDDDLLADTITRTARRGGSCLLPTFAVDRTPVIVSTLNRLRAEGRIPQDIPVYVDSPMALRAWEIYRSAVNAHDPQLRTDLDVGALEWQNHVVAAKDRTESERLNQPAYPSVVVSASGMATGGRVLHHLREQLPEPRNSIILTGFQVPGTRGQELADGSHQVKIQGRYVPVRAEVVSLHGFSAHADRRQLLEWLSGLASPEATYVVHGEPAASAALAAGLREGRGWTTVVPRHLERVRLD